jgi:hypothetical protein
MIARHVAVPAHAEVDVALLAARDERRVDRVDVGLDRDEELLGLLDLASSSVFSENPSAGSASAKVCVEPSRKFTARPCTS